jgi:hypothetical protein
MWNSPVVRENPISLDIIDVFDLCRLWWMPLLFAVIRAAIRTLFMRKQALLLENLALRQQLATSPLSTFQHWPPKLGRATR